jgi:calmodulin
MAEDTPLTAEQIEQFQTAMSEFYENDDESKLVDLFRLFDRNGDGKIVRTELRTVMTSVSGERVAEDEVNDMLNEADTNTDGNIDLAEFILVMKKHKQ